MNTKQSGLVIVGIITLEYGILGFISLDAKESKSFTCMTRMKRNFVDIHI